MSSRNVYLGPAQRQAVFVGQTRLIDNLIL